MNAAICIGSNLGNRKKNLSDALELIGKKPLAILRVSGIYESEPVGFESAHYFLNQVVLIDTELTAEVLLNELLKLETQLGRTRSDVTTDRLIDLDLLFYGEQVFRTSGLTIPHPRLHLRKFVLIPLADVAINWRHPILESTIGKLLLTCNDQSQVTEF